jgi:hypothetical protein
LKTIATWIEIESELGVLLYQRRQNLVGSATSIGEGGVVTQDFTAPGPQASNNRTLIVQGQLAGEQILDVRVPVDAMRVLSCKFERELPKRNPVKPSGRTVVPRQPDPGRLDDMLHAP